MDDGKHGLEMHIRRIVTTRAGKRNGGESQKDAQFKD